MFTPSLRHIVAALALVVAGSITAEAQNVPSIWMTEQNRSGEFIRIDFSPDSTYKRYYELSPKDIILETGSFEMQRDGSVRLYNISLGRGIPSAKEEILSRRDQN